MNIKKFFAAVAATAVAVSTMAVSAFAADYTAKLGFSDMNWTAQDWEASTTVTGDGTYTIESTLVAGAPDFGVFVIDIEGMYAGNPEATAVLDKIEIDGAEVSFDASKIIYGDIEEKGNYRIEIYNQYGDTKNDPPVIAQAINESLKITFTVSGLGGGEAAATEEAAPVVEETTAAATGNTAAAAIVAVMTVAGAAAIASRKRK